jgi:hypothetical protein
MAIDYTQFSQDGKPNSQAPSSRWWTLKNHDEIAQAVCAVVQTLSQADSVRQSQMQTSARLYGNVSLMGLTGLTFARGQRGMPGTKERITYNVAQSGVDTITSKMVKNKPKPLFLTSGGDWKIQRRAQKLSKFIDGIFYENQAYDQGRMAFRDSAVVGDGLVHVFNWHNRVKFERVLAGEILVDEMEAIYGKPRQLHRTRNVDRAVLMDLFPEKKSVIQLANAARTETQGQSVADQVSVIESWHLPSGPEAKDGLRVICLESGLLEKEEWSKDYFPFARLPWTPRLYGYWSQGGVEQVQSIQLEINKLLWVIQRSMHMAGTFKILAERGAKIVKEHFNNDFGTVMEYTGVPPSYIIPPIVPPEIYQHLQTLKGQAFEVLGVSQLSATSQKPAGLNSGKALREFQDIESERFTAIGQQYESFYLELAKLSIDVVKEIFETEKSYEIKIPGKKFLETIDWKDIELEEDEYVMKVFPVSSLPNEPAGRLQTIQEYIQAGFMTPRAGRRLLDFPDLEQAETMANSKEDWLHEVLEKMLDEEEFFYQPEPDDDLALARELALEYIAFAKVTKVEDQLIQKLRDFLEEVKGMIALASAPQEPGVGPQANPMPTPQSDLVPNVPQLVA